jgi:hypothetical protein
MADYISEASASPEVVPAKTIEDYTTAEYSLEQANEALDIIEDCMNWAFFGVGGPA